MVIVNCDQDHEPEGLKPQAVMTSTEPDTPSVAAPTMSTTTNTPNENTNATKSSTKEVMDASVSEVWYLKPVTFSGRHTRIITQNFNGFVSVNHRAVAVKIHVTEADPLQTVFVHCHL